MNYTIARLTDGMVKANGWWSPGPGKKVYLTKHKSTLWVHRSLEDTVGVAISYTWPRGHCDTVAGRMAWEHYARKTSL